MGHPKRALGMSVVIVALVAACGGGEEPTTNQGTSGDERPGPTAAPADAGPAAEPADAAPVLDPEERLAAAREAYEVGLRAYEAGRYEEALERFREAHAGTADPAVLFNIGLAADQLGQSAEALRAYERFLQQRPDADNREVLEHRIEELRQELAAEGPPGG